MKARIKGSRGTTVVTGAQLRTRLGLRDTWFYVRRVRTNAGSRREARTLRGARPLVALHGTVDAGRSATPWCSSGAPASGWRKIVTVPAGGRRLPLPRRPAGIYRVKAGWAAGPPLRVAPPALG